MAGEKSK